MNKIFKNFRDFIEIANIWASSPGKFWRTTVDGQSIEAVDIPEITTLDAINSTLASAVNVEQTVRADAITVAADKADVIANTATVTGYKNFVENKATDVVSGAVSAQNAANSAIASDASAAFSANLAGAQAIVASNAASAAVGITQDMVDFMNTHLNNHAAENAEVNVNADWNATEGDAFIQNKPFIPVTYSDVGAAPSVHSHEVSGVNGLEATLSLKADLVNGLVPANQLPSFVDDVLEYADLASFPVSGESGKIYVAIDTGLSYRWSGSTYGALDPSLALGTTSTTAFRGDYGNTAWAHSQITSGNPHNTTLSHLGIPNVENYAQQILHGFATRSTQTFSPLPFDDSTRTFYLYRVSDYTIYVGGKAIVITSNKSIVISNTVGQHFISFNASGNLVESTTPFDILDLTLIPVATVNWDSVRGVVADGRHSCRRNLEYHKQAHQSWGSTYISGFTATPTFNSNNTFSFTGGIINDEDLQHDSTILDTLYSSNGNAHTGLSLGYKLSGQNAMSFTVRNLGYAVLNGSIPRYDNNGTLTDIPATATTYGITWVYATNRPFIPIAGVLGQGVYASVAAAQSAAQPTLYGMSVAEWKLLYRVIYRRLSGALSFVQADVMYNLSTGPAILAGAPQQVAASNVLFNPTALEPSTNSNAQAAIESRLLVTGGNITAYSEAVVTSTIVSGSVNIDCSLANVFNFTLIGNTTFTIINPKTSGTATNILLHLTQDATGNRIITWPGTVSWGYAGQPTLSAATKKDIISLSSLDGGTTWIAMYCGGGF